MDELIGQVAQRAGIDQTQARTAVDSVLEFLKQRLPAPIAGQVEGALSGGGDIGAQAGGLASGLGGMLGGDRER